MSSAWLASVRRSAAPLDLVFVFAVGRLAHHLHGEFSWRGAAESGSMADELDLAPLARSCQVFACGGVGRVRVRAGWKMTCSSLLRLLTLPAMDSAWAEGLVNVVDVEATCWAGGQPRGEVSEIIEIGLTVVDLAAGERVARHGILVRPARSMVSEFCTELTGLTQQEVDQGVTFAEACRLLAAEHHAGARPWVSWGDYDRHQFTRQCQATRTPYPFGRCHTNAKAVFTEAYGLRKRPGMAQALGIAGQRLEGRHHRGEDDAWNIAALVLHLCERGVWPATAEHPA